MPFTSSPITVKDGASADKALIAYNDGTNSAFAHPILDDAGAIISPATAANQATANGKLDTIIANSGAGSVVLTAAPTVAGTTHAANDVCGGKISLSGAARVSAGGGIIQQVCVHVKDAVTAAYDVLFFVTDPTNSTFTDDAAIALASADQPFLVGVASCTQLVDCGTRKTLQASQLGLPFKLSAGTTLYAVIVVRSSAAYTTSNALTLSVGVLQD